MPSLLSSSSPRLFFSPTLSPNPHHHLLFPKTPPSLFLSSFISFQRLSKPSPHPPIRSHQHHQDPPPPLQQQAASSPPPSSEDVDPTLLPSALRDIIALFQSVPDPKAKYHQLLHYSRQLPPLDPRYKTDEHRVRGCVSQVWVRAFPDPSDPVAVRFETDSDSALTKGLAALLVLGLSGSPAPAVARVPPAFVHLLGLRQSLTPSRNNGFLNMLRLMQQKALQLYTQDGNSVSDLQGSNSDEKDLNSGVSSNGFSRNPIVSEDLGAIRHSGSVDTGDLEGKDASLDQNGDDLDVKEDDTDGAILAPSSSGGGLGGRAERIREILERELSPEELVVEDISHRHAGHAGVRGSSGGETHFNLRVVSEEFEGKSLVKRHRLVYGLLQEELQSGLHALSIDAKTPSEVRPS